MGTQKNKDSIFSGIFPSAEPEPVRAPAQPAPSPDPVPRKPAVSEEQVAALNAKIELMERNIVGQIEKKLSEQPPPPPPPPSTVTPAVLSKMNEMEARFKEFQDKFMLGAAQMKNIEESKISARREIEELLKVVREQQKYSELDRQMHDQLEKAWSRVEEMEKRLVEAYAAAANRPALPPAIPAPAVSTAEIAAAVLRAVDSRLEERLKPVESALKSAASKLGESSGDSRAEELLAAFEARFSDFASEMVRLHSASVAFSERAEVSVTEIKAGMRGMAQEAVDRAAGGMARHLDASALDSRERLDVMSGMLVSHLDTISATQKWSAEKLEEVGREVKKEIAREKEEFISSVRDTEHSLQNSLDSLAAQVRAENALQLERVMDVVSLSASSQSALHGAVAAVSSVESRLGELNGALKKMVVDLQRLNLEGILGVSGAILRKNLGAAAELAGEFEKSSGLISEKRGELQESLRRFRPPAGESEK